MYRCRGSPIEKVCGTRVFAYRRLLQLQSPRKAGAPSAKLKFMPQQSQRVTLPLGGA